MLASLASSMVQAGGSCGRASIRHGVQARRGASNTNFVPSKGALIRYEAFI